MTSIHSSDVQTNKAVQHCALWTALVTPFNQNGSVDFISLREIAQHQAAAGNGILLLGSTGEGLALTAEEQFSIVDFICGLALDTPLMVAVGGSNLSEQLQWLAQCNSLPIDAYLLATPIYAKPGPVGQTQWFSALLDAAKFPCMLYNVPSRSGVDIPVETLQQIQNHQNCWAMKEASGDINKFLAYRQHCPEIDLYSGEDAMVPYLVSGGVKGLVSVCANAWPEATKKYVECCLSKTATQCQTLFPLWQNAVDALFAVANPIPVKVLMHQQGVISHNTLRAPLTALELANSDDIQHFDQRIAQWLAAYST
ncbi:4-hydroxy-tetrahydrodipicolinate synthase [Colwellia asteriadis]|uniref:4-hydroxy-tetrahydrodipicolinate synthase n=1 Tax=Colwellia asteriadis TaxID=517723 RepID=A0ABN1L4X9_9GAMM